MLHSSQIRPKGAPAAVAFTVGAVVLAAVLAIAGCGGGGQKEFSASEFVDAANDEGAGLVLGEKLISGQKDVEVFGLSFDSGSGGSGEGHGSASLTISPDSASAKDVWEQCEATGTFVCYRANNASLVFDQGTDPDALNKVDSAIRAMASD